MNFRTNISIAVFALTSTMAFWMKALLFNYVGAIVLMATTVLAVLERRHWYVLAGMALALVSSIFDSVTGAGATEISMMLGILVVGPAVCAYFINNGQRVVYSYTAGAIVIALVCAWIYGQHAEILNRDIDWFFKEYATNHMVNLLKTGGYGIESINNATDGLTQLGNMLQRFVPGLFVLVGISHLFAVILFVEWFYARRDGFFPGFGNFLYWRAPEILLYILGVVLVIRLLTSGTGQMISDNTLLVFSVVFAMTGFSFLEFQLRKLRIPLFLRIVFYIGMTFTSFAGYVITMVIGLFDSFFDFRKTKAHTLG